MKLRRCISTCAVAAALVSLGASRAHAQEGPYVEAMAELSPVKIGGYETTWRVGRVGGGIQTSHGGWNAAVERHERGRLIDWTGQAGAFQRLGDWTWDAAAAYSQEPQFLYRESYEAGVSRRIVGGLVLRGGYRYLEFPSTIVRIAEPGTTFYFARGEVGAQGFIVSNDTSANPSTIVLVRSAIDLSRHVAISGGAAIGARIFDVDTSGHSSQDAWQAFASMRVHSAAHWTMELIAGGAHEDPLFNQQTVATRLRWTF